MRQPPLPKAGPTTPRDHVFHVRPAKPVAPEDGVLVEARARFRGSSTTLAVPEVVEQLHPLLRKRQGSPNSAHIAIEVETKETRARAVRVMHTILTELDRLGLSYAPKIVENPHGRFRHRVSKRIEVDVHGEAVAFNISEWVRDFWQGDPDRTMSSADRLTAGLWGKTKRMRAGDGKLRIQLGLERHDMRTWRDDDRGLVETKLASFFHALFARALAERVWRREQARREREWKITERARRRADAVRRQDELLRTDALRRVELLVLAERVREVVERVQAAGREGDAAWTAWATGYAARLDLQVVDALPSMTVRTDDEEEQPPDDDE